MVVAASAEAEVRMSRWVSCDGEAPHRHKQDVPSSPSPCSGSACGRVENARSTNSGVEVVLSEGPPTCKASARAAICSLTRMRAAWNCCRSIEECDSVGEPTGPVPGDAPSGELKG